MQLPAGHFDFINVTVNATENVSVHSLQKTQSTLLV